ncbi:MAG: alkaline phosphatase family protein [Clostridia bacterium]|nr:alkaline phosphatase family protein [Clostridia bacterium]
MDQNRHVIVISEDALVYDDLETLRQLPAFGELMKKGSLVKTIRSVYPTVTYPCHTSMCTGVPCGRHGVVNNERDDDLTREHSPWEWFHSAVKTGDIFDAAKAAGLTTAAVFWPVTGNHPHIDYLIDEYWPQSPEETTEACFAASGSSPEIIEKVIRPNRHLLDGKHRIHPHADAFVHACAGAIIRRFKPNLLMIHPANIDGYRHKTGMFSPLVTHGLHQIDVWLGEILKALDDAGIRESTDLFIVSDHGQMNITRTVALNALLAERGLVTVNAEGRIADYTAVAHSAGMSAQVYVKHPEDTERVYAALKQMAEDGLYGFGRVYTAQEAREEEGLYGGFSFVLETDGYTSFSNACTRPFVRPADNSDYKFGRATHGYHPDKGPQPTLLACGPHIRPGVVLERRSILDEAPTYARILGVELPDAEGKAMEEILADC